MNGTTIAVDLAKSIFEVAISDRPGQVRERHRLSRLRFLDFFTRQQPATVLLEACGSAHYWGRQLESLGHQVVLLPPHCVRPYVVRNKTDRADAKGILEAYRNEEIHPVPVKTLDQQSVTALHRLRSAWMAERTARINTLRGLLREFGLTLPVGSHHVVPGVLRLLEDAGSPVPDLLRPLFREVTTEIRDLEARVRRTERLLEALARQTPAVQHLRSVPGIGLLTATALVAFVGDPRRFPSGRRLASYLGLTPRERSSGLTRRTGAISKRGDRYLRMLLIHGARATLCHARKDPHPAPLLAWALDTQRLRGHNKATVALANKLARIAWKVWSENRDFQPVRKEAA